jgi:threonylcarbamoyladenosine tRNA methylthiotransferase MtaB
VASDAISRRSATLQRLSRAKRLSFHQTHIGQTLPVLFEHDGMSGYRFGTTDNFMKVAVEASIDLRNRIGSVTVTAASDQYGLGHLAAAPNHGRSLVRP